MECLFVSSGNESSRALNERAAEDECDVIKPINEQAPTGLKNQSTTIFEIGKIKEPDRRDYAAKWSRFIPEGVETLDILHEMHVVLSERLENLFDQLGPKQQRNFIDWKIGDAICYFSYYPNIKRLLGLTMT